MKKILLILFLIASLMTQAQEQDNIKGNISYITSTNVYIKFSSTKHLQPGDTLYIAEKDKQIPAFIVNSLSSMSCVATPIIDRNFKIGDSIISTDKRIEIINTSVSEQPTPDVATSEDEAEEPASNLIEPTTLPEDQVALKQRISGKIGVASYTNFSNTSAGSSQKMRYTLSFNAENISGSRFSTETYISFVHRDQEWNLIQDNIFNGLKIYNLAVHYQIPEKAHFWFGRKINPKLSSVGAIDGLQAEVLLGSFSVGAIFGSRPDYADYSINPALGQYGGFVGHEVKTKNGILQTSAAFVEQKNAGKTDRRFVYLQHANNLLPKLYVFGSAELDMYKIVQDVTDHSTRLTNLYLMLRYRFHPKYSASLSFSSRNNIIYYETYKDLVERLLEAEATQGFSLQLTARPFKYTSFGARAGYRNRKQDPKPSKNLYVYGSYLRLPLINASTTVSFTLLETSYLNGEIYSIQFNKDLLKGKVYTGIGYRHVNYQFYNADSKLSQHMAELNINWRIYKRLSTGIYYEGTFEKINTFNRIYINLTQRF